jgi:hypothetical protein
MTTVLASPVAAQVDPQRAQEFFKDVQAACEREGKRLWGISLCGPMVIADARTQTIATSQPVPEGPRPRLGPGMNAPIQWGGATWAAYNWDTLATAPPLHAREILLHELFHGLVQLKLGLAASEVLNEHLDVMEGRYWLRLECRALARALRESGAQRNTAVRDALAFRQARHLRYQGSAEKERALEINEGVASYTGVAAAADSVAGAVTRGIEILAACDGNDSFVRTFAYWTGPAYGLLLDAASSDWRQRIRGTDDFPALLARALNVQPATDAAASATQYGGAEIRAAEERRERAGEERLAELRSRFVEGPVLVIRGGGGGAFNSMGAAVIPDVGTVFFGPYSHNSESGTLQAEKGVLVESSGSVRRVPAPSRRDDMTLTGDGWTFTVKPGFVIREGARKGDYEIVRQQP